ncbi:hypothetical protein HYFRA_00008685 [Hymenoscyphus fraxineus]|uniref:chitinase n=1 Tax=Hymenoscyphus fraxineus TaxID=746836 RepID=A0A9N9PPT2_9HELO|nr:hypothetical protein HYFRA_00008685 [Hymenoscyphus fraxineus]
MTSYINAIYYPSWKVYKGRSPATLDISSVTHIFYAFARVNDDGTLRLLDEYADTEREVDGEKGCLAALAKLKLQKPSLKTLLSVGGGSGSANFPIFAATSTGRENFARTSREFVDRFSLDGIDVDWEHPQTPTAGKNYIHLLHTTRQHLPPPYLLTTALPTGTYCLKNISLLEASQYLSFLNLMAYDFTGSWTAVSGHHAQLFSPPSTFNTTTNPCLQKSTHTAVEYILSQRFPASKIILGIPLYARYFPGATAPGQSFEKGGEMEYRDMDVVWRRDAVVDEDCVAEWYVDSNKGFGFVSFDGVVSVRRKAEYVLERGLGGLFFWTGVGDLEGGSLVGSTYSRKKVHKPDIKARGETLSST